jgi:hypothetical protein
MATTYEKIATTTLGSASSTITFSSIAASWTDLRLVLTSIPTAAANLNLTFNSDTGANYSRTRLGGDGTTATSGRNNSQTYIRATGVGVTNPYMVTLDIFSYAGSTYKTCLITSAEDANGSGGINNIVGLWLSTSAITTITYTTSASTFATGTTATLYGILKA